MKPILILITLLIGIGIYGYALGEEELNGQLYVDFDKETAVYKETYEWETTMSASVEKSDCLKCLDFTYITDCQALGFCLDVVVN